MGELSGIAHHNENKTEFRFADGCHLSPAPSHFQYYLKRCFIFMMTITKRKSKGASRHAPAGKGFEKMKILPIVCRGAEAKPAAR
ncbi:hypothetical protein J4733_17140 [Klebsiella pneumoniae]|uniref:Uncharacterized protein n=1 Tax=Klebsiella pneumoniae TaxID=573 RepID=A0A939NLP6_KLEPN|nr:hypothetical protein [Klebsiella pneumoniae]